MTRRALIPSPVAQRRIDRTFPPLVVQELSAIEKSLGGRDEVVGMLTLAPLTPDLRYVLGLLGDPQHRQRSLAEVCALGNVLPGTLLQHLSGAALLKGKVLASQKVGEAVAAVAEDVMRRAAPYEETCHGCLGTGSSTPDPTPTTPNPQPAPCETCRGIGKLRYQPDLERQKLALDLAQLLPKSSGIQIAMQQNNHPGGGSGPGSGLLDRLQAISDRALYGDDADGADLDTADVVDAEVTPADTPDPPA